MIYSREIDSAITLGINFKPVLSQLEKYSSFGFAFDIGVSYRDKSNLFSAGFVVRNMGLEVTTYAGEKRQKLPFEIQAGLSRKLAHAPLRFSVTIRHMEKFDLTCSYADTTSSGSHLLHSDFFENIARHLVIGTEVIPHKNFYFSAGYNHQRRKELQVEPRKAATGFSWGFGVNTSWFSIGFGRATYHLAGSSNHLSLIIRPDLLYNKFRE
jgi:hypothetical protein